ncbi:L-lactate permease [Arcanobacterium sp. S3PF19]|uniref:L-lactate permease n=1 Tax=Arcanobacterium sp. S3PF19 TaxID=1219585 RepID=UPI00051060F5|nr:L-lactate permease [Arcanobacterium sp. S3PF19]KGF06109.1 L-lactate permease [Arcanobacterium sp. S3PF19]
MENFLPTPDAICHSPALSALVGILPLLTFFVLLGAFKLKTHLCALGSLIAAALIAKIGFAMPVPLIGLSAAQGFAFGLAPILYIVVAAVWLYNLTVASNRADDVRTVFSTVGKGDMRIQGLLIGFSFCGLLEGLAGFGAPVAIVAAMLVSLGLKPLKAALVTMVGNAISVGFGAMAIPVTTAGRLGGTDGAAVAWAATGITPLIAAFIPLLLLFIMDGMRGIKQLWAVAVVQGAVTAAGHLAAGRLISYELTAVLASLLGFAVVAVLLTFFRPSTPEEFSSEMRELPSASRITLGLMPYWLVVIIFAVAKLWTFGINIPKALSATDITIRWPGLYGHLLAADGSVSGAPVYTLQTLSGPGTMIVLTALIVSAVYGRYGRPGKFEFSFGRGIKTLFSTIAALRLSLLTIALVMSLAYVMNFSGQTLAIGSALAATGAAFAFLSPILGWLGTAVTGSATSANALFANLQATAGTGAHLDPNILLAANTVGGGIGKIVSPQNLAIASTAINEPGCEPQLLRKAAPWSTGLLLVLCAVIFSAARGLSVF